MQPRSLLATLIRIVAAVLKTARLPGVRLCVEPVESSVIATGGTRTNAHGLIHNAIKKQGIWAPFDLSI